MSMVLMWNNKGDVQVFMSMALMLMLRSSCVVVDAQVLM